MVEATPDPAEHELPLEGERSNPLPEDYYRPTGAPEALSGYTAPPLTKRFNRKTVAVLIGTAALVTIAALGTALTRQRLGAHSGDGAATGIAAAPALNDAVNALPNHYDQTERSELGVPRLGPRMSGDMGALGTTMGMNANRALSAYEQAVAQEALDERKRAEKAREGGFGFSGGENRIGVVEAAEAGAPAFGDHLDHALSGIAAGGLEQSLAARDTDNRQDDKTSFASKDRKSSWRLPEAVQTSPSPYTVFAGAVLPGVMITEINSDLPGPIEGQISQNVYDTVTGQHLLVPQGTKVLGSYDSRITYGQSRVLVVWTRLIRPDGSNIDLEGMPGVDMSGAAGEISRVDRHLARLLGAVLLGSLIQAGTSAGTAYTNPSFTDLARQGAGQGVNEATQQILRKELNIQPTLIVLPGTRFNVFTTKDIVLPPYGSP